MCELQGEGRVKPNIGQLSVTIADWARGNSSVSAAWIFGSVAKGTAREDSDVDIAIQLVRHPSAFALYLARGDEWQRHLASMIGRPVSLEALPDEEPVRSEILATAISVFSRSL